MQLLNQTSRPTRISERKGTATANSPDGWQSGLSVTMTGVAALAPLVGALAPRGLAPLLVGGAVAGTVAYRVHAPRLPIPSTSWLITVCGMVLFAAATIAWTPAPGKAMEQIVQFLYLLLPPLFLLAALSEADGSGCRAIRWLVPAFLLAVAVLMVETLLELPIRSLIRGEKTLSPDLSDINRNLVATVALLWPAMLAAVRMKMRRIAVLMPAGLAIPVLLGESQSAQLGLVVGIAVLPFAVASPQLARRLLGTATVIVFAGIIPLCLWFPDSGLEWLPFSAQHRAAIWRFSAEQILHHPLLGWGLDASRKLGDGQVAQALGDAAGLLPLHPHNAYLQIWLELGLIGTTIALILCLLVIRAIGRLDESAQPTALAAYASTAAMAGVSYGIWQSWWLSTLLLTVVLTVVCGRGRHGQSRP
jgi:exopolysaccharide production protein ExoQ